MLQFGASRNFFLQGKTKEDVRKSKEGYGQLLLAMFSVFLKFGKPVWGIGLSPKTVQDCSKTIAQKHGENCVSNSS